MQYCQYKESCRLQLHVSRHLNPFHPAYMHKKWCRKIDANRQWHGAPPSKMVMGSIPTGDAVTGPHIRCTLSIREMSL